MLNTCSWMVLGTHFSSYTLVLQRLAEIHQTKKLICQGSSRLARSRVSVGVPFTARAFRVT